jgi:hypothetical protein
MLSIKKLFSVETLLGIGLGLGYLTSLRFIGKIGLSEILVLISIIILLSKNYKVFFIYKRNLENYIKIYILLALFIQLPVLTLTTSIITDYNSDPKYIISFIMGAVLAFLLSNASQFNNFNFSRLTLFFFYAFVGTNLISFIFFPSLTEVYRYAGAAKNPNQLMFYASSLTLLLLIYNKKLSIIGIPVVIWIVSKTQSDAYFFTLYMTILFYFLFIFFFHSKHKFSIKVIFFLICFTVLSFIIINTYSEELLEIWFAADEGGGRIMLMLNGMDVIKSSPIVGWGAGSFSGFVPFGRAEAHSTPIDLGMQLGIVFPIILYGIMFVAMFKKLKDKEYLVAAFILGFIFSGFFHYTARHFTFWVELSIFYSYAFHNYLKSDALKTT